MGENPFSESGEGDRTMIRPTPGGRRVPPAGAPPPRAPAGEPPTVLRPTPVAPQDAPVSRGAEVVTAPGTPLAAAAAPLLHLLSRLRNTARQPDPGDLLERAALALRTFDQRAREAEVPQAQVRAAHYALCASLDDAVLNTPWGAASNWAKRPLTAIFHQDAGGDDGRFFDMLARMNQDPAKFVAVIEIVYLCLSLGYMGKYRQSPQGRADLDRIRAATCAAIAGQRDRGKPELSRAWKGVDAPYKPSRGGLPSWVVQAAALAACAAMFLWASTALNAASDDQYARMQGAPPSHMPEITRAAAVQPLPSAPAPTEPSILDRLRDALQRDVDAGTVSVIGTPATPVIRVANRAGFAAGGAAAQPALVEVLERIGSVLKNEPGQVQAIAYTDSQPIHTVKFPSNFQLSDARAKAARAVLARTIGDASRLGAEGRADADPVASNATAEGREANRRIEIVLHRPE